MKIKRLLSLALVLLLVLTCVPLHARATEVASGTCGDNLTWVLDNEGTLTITGEGEMWDLEGNNSWWYDYQVVTAIIEDGVTTIGDYAFCYCDSLKNIIIPDSVTTIGDYAFYYCDSLASTTIPDNVDTIGSYAFGCCDSLTSVYIPASVTTIGYLAFAYCGNLTGIHVDLNSPNYSSDSTGVLFNKEKTSLIQAPGTIEGSYEIPNSVTTISDYAFMYCGDLTAVIIPDTVTYIGENAFSNCSALTSVAIPASVTAIGEEAFLLCTSLTGIHVDSNNPYYSSDSTGVLFNKDKNILRQAPGAITEYVIPNSVTNIGHSAFYGCRNLTSVTIPESVTTIGDWGFWACTSLSSITIPDSVTIIGDRAFENCRALTSITLPESVIYVGSYAFTQCWNLTSVTIYCNVSPGEYTFAQPMFTNLTEVVIGRNVTSIGFGAFYNNDSLNIVCYDGTQAQWAELSIAERNDSLLNANIHFNENGDHLCDDCGRVFSNCIDENTDYTCDICGAELENPSQPGTEEVARESGSNRFDTATLVADQMKEALGVEKFDAVILANGYNFADALAGSYLSAMKKAPILLTWNGAEKYNYLNDATIAYVKANLKPGGTVYILGGTSAVPASIDSALSGFTIKRMDGANRFETNLMILEEAGVKSGSEILVCTSTNFADSLSASAAGKPILLVFNESGKLYGDQPKFLSNLKNCTFTVIGGENAVSKKLADAVGKYGKVTRLAGANRFETSVMVAEKYFPEATSAVLAYAWDFPDGLCGGGLAYTMGAPLILTMTKYETQAADYIQSQGIKSGVVLGGEKLISAASVDKIFGN